MLNLSDKELDRLSREAAQEHDPGDLIGPRSWERLEVRLDRDLGKVSPNPLRGIRRLPFYYAPALLLILGVSYYFVKQGKARKAVPSGSPPMTVVKPLEGNTPLPNKNSDHSENSTSTPDKQSVTVPYPAPSNSGQSSAVPSVASPAVSSAGSSAAPSAGSPAPNGTVTHAGETHAATAGSATEGGSATGRDRTLSSRDRTLSSSIAPSNKGNVNIGKKGHNASGKGSGPAGNHTGGQPENAGSGATRTASSGINPRATGTALSGINPGTSGKASSGAPSGAVNSGAPGITSLSASSGSRELTLSSVTHARSMRRSPSISDSALRAFTAKTAPAPPIKRKGVLRVNRSLQLGLSVAPDFSSVNSLAGDRPGSSIGLTADYQFANRWYIGSGLLLSRKNYAARAQDYHAPYSFYQANNLHNVDFVKGTLNMLEIPLNLRYDFSVTGNTVFFASAGLSSYLFTRENCNYYYNSFMREIVRGFDYPTRDNFLFSAVNLSLGVEAGISNNFSLLVAPYMKLPTGNLGFGKIQMNSVGINFALKYTPVLSKKRR